MLLLCLRALYGLVENADRERPTREGVSEERLRRQARQILEVADRRSGEGNQLERRARTVVAGNALPLEVVGEVLLHLGQREREPTPHDEPALVRRDDERVEVIGIEVRLLPPLWGAEQARYVLLRRVGEETGKGKPFGRLPRPEEPRRIREAKVVGGIGEQVAESLAVGPGTVEAERGNFGLLQPVREECARVSRHQPHSVRPDEELDGMGPGNRFLLAAEQAFGRHPALVGGAVCQPTLPEPAHGGPPVQELVGHTRHDEVARLPRLLGERSAGMSDLLVVAERCSEGSKRLVVGVRDGFVQ